MLEIILSSTSIIRLELFNLHGTMALRSPSPEVPPEVEVWKHGKPAASVGSGLVK